MIPQPNGLDCKYRHALPPGFVLNSEKKKKEAEAKAKVITLEEFLESEVRPSSDASAAAERAPRLTLHLTPAPFRSATSSVAT